MSVTFHFRILDSDFRGFEIKNWETEEVFSYPDYQAALAGWETLGASPQDWSLSPVYAIPEELSVNMANSNARDVLDVLGLGVGQPFSEWCSGDIEADDLIGRCLVALALDDSPAKQGRRETGENGATLIEAMRPAGYTLEKCRALLRLAEAAKAAERDIVWT